MRFRAELICASAPERPPFTRHSRPSEYPSTPLDHAEDDAPGRGRVFCRRPHAPDADLANARASSARAPVARMDEVAAATAQLADLQAQLAKLEELKQLEAQLRQMQAAAPPAAVTPPPAAVVPPPPVAVTPPPLPVQPPPAITTPPPAAVPPPPEVVAPPPVPMPAPAPEAAAAAAQSSGFQMPQMQMPSLPQMPATPMPEPYQIPSDSMNPLLVDVAVVAAVPLLAYGIASCWDVLKGPEDDSAVPPQPWEANFGMPAGSGDRSAPDIFLGGVENLAKEPLGWLSGEPSPLNSYNGAGNPGAAPAGGAPRPMGGTPLLSRLSRWVRLPAWGRRSPE